MYGAEFDESDFDELGALNKSKVRRGQLIYLRLVLGAVIRGADGQEISVKEALESMPEGGSVNPDGTLNPDSRTTTNPDGSNCVGPCPEPDLDGDGNPG